MLLSHVNEMKQMLNIYKSILVVVCFEEIIDNLLSYKLRLNKFQGVLIFCNDSKEANELCKNREIDCHSRESLVRYNLSVSHLTFGAFRGLQLKNKSSDLHISKTFFIPTFEISTVDVYPAQRTRSSYFFSVSYI